MVPLGMPCRVMDMRAASVLPSSPDSSWMGMFSVFAVSRSQRRIFGWVIRPESLMVRVGPLPILTVVSNSRTPGTSPAMVTSSAMARSGSMPNAAVAAPRRPTSSCTVPTAQMLQSVSWMSFMVSIMAAHPARLSKAFPMAVSLLRGVYFTSKVMGSPIVTPQLVVSSLFLVPMSMKRSSWVMIFLRSSSFCIWGGFEPMVPG